MNNHNEAGSSNANRREDPVDSGRRAGILGFATAAAIGTFTSTASAQATGGDYLTPDMFGAVGNGTTPDDAAFSSMLAAIGSRGGRILIPPKRYALSSDLVLANKPFVVEGVAAADNNRGSTLVFAANKGLILESASHSIIDGLRLQSTTSSSSGQLLGVGRFGGSASTAGSVIRNVVLDGGYRSLWVRGALYPHFHACRIRGATGPQAVLIGGGPDSTHRVDGALFVGCTLSAANDTNCVELNGAAHSVKMTQCAVLFGKSGIVMRKNSEGTAPKFFYFSDGGFENGTGYCFYVSEGDDIKFTNSYFSNDGSLDGVYMGASLLGSVKIVGSTIRGCGRDGIRYLGGRLRAIGNDIVNNGRDVVGDGVRIAAECDKFVIAENYIGAAQDGTTNQRYGILNLTAAGATRKIANNVLSGNVSGGLFGTVSGAGIINN